MQTVNQLNKKDYLSNIIKGLLLATNVAFLVYFVVLAIYSRPHYDDLHFMWKLQEMSIFDYVKDMYFSRSGRFGGYLLNGLIFNTINAVGSHWYMPLIFIGIGMAISCYVATKCLPNINKWWLCNGVILFYFIYLLSNIDFAVVYWLCAMGYYLKFPVALLMFYFINKRSLNIWQWIILILSTITIGAGNEAFSPLFLVLLSLNGLYYLQQNQWKFKTTFADTRIKRMFIIAAAVIILMVVVIIAPGNYARMADATQFHRPNTICEWIKGLGKASVTYHYFLLFYFLYYLVLMALSYLLGVKAKLNNSFSNLLNNKKRIIIGIVILYLIYIFCTILPSVFLYGNFGVQRNYTHTVYMTMLTLCSFGFMFGYWKSNLKKFFQIISILGLSVLIGITIMNCKIDFPTSKAYAQSVDKRIAFCNQKKSIGDQDLVEVDPLVVPNTIDVKYTLFRLMGKNTSKPMLYYTSENENFFDEYTYHMKRLYGWEFDIVMKNE